MKCFANRKKYHDNDVVSSNKLKIEPPKDCQYTITKINNDINTLNTTTKHNKGFLLHGNRFESVLFNTDYFIKTLQCPWITINCYLYKKSLPDSKYEGKQLVIIHLISLRKVNKCPFTFLLSQGPESTLGISYPFLIDLCTQMKSDIIAYDYSGYGHSEGKPIEDQIKSDIEEVASFATTILMIKPNFLLPFGISIGAMPSIDLINTKAYYDTIPGLIVLSPYIQGFNTKPAKKDQDDGLEYYDKIQNINCPVFLIHGQQDNMIPFDQSEDLSSKFKLLFKWFPSKAHHDDIISNHRYKFYTKLKTFTNELISQSNQLRVSYKISFNSPSVRKKKIVINSDYAENGESFDANLALEQGKEHVMLFDLLSDYFDDQAYSDEDFSNDKLSKSIKKVGTLHFGNTNTMQYDEDMQFDDSYYSDTELNIANDEIVLNKDITSPFKSPLKFSIIPVTQSATIKKKKSMVIGKPIRSPLLSNSIKKMNHHNNRKMILSQKTFNYKKLNTHEIDLKPISDFPDLE